MKVVSLNLSTLATGNYAPMDKSNLANCRWLINWREILGEYHNSNKTCKVKGKLISAPSTLLTSANNLGTVRLSLASNYSNITNGLTLGIPIIRQTADTNATITQFVGSTSGTTLTVNPFGYGTLLQVIGGTGGLTVSTLTLATGSTGSIPIGSVITGFGIAGYCTIIGQTGNLVYTMSSNQNIATGTNITVSIPNNVCLAIGSVITGNGVLSNTTITAQTGPYAYTISRSQTLSSIPMMANQNNYYFDLDTQGTNGLTISVPQDNYLNVQFLRTDEVNLMQNVPEYTLLLNFDFDDDKYDSD